MTVVKENFNRADGALSTPWVRQWASSNVLGIVSDQLAATGSGAATFYSYAGAANGDSQYAQVKIVSNPSDQDWGPAVRCASGTGAGSGYFYEQYNGSHLIGKYFNGSFTSLKSASDSTTSAPVAGDVLRIEVYNTSPGNAVITVFLNGTQIDTFTDTSALAGGMPGVYDFNPAFVVDDWEGGDLVFPITGLLDDFNRANGAVGSNWSNDPFHAGSTAFTIQSNGVAPVSSGTYSEMWWNAAQFANAAGIEVWGTVKSIPDTSNAFNGFWMGVIQQPSASVATADGYQVGFTRGSANDACQIYRYDNGAITALGTSVNLTNRLAVGDVLGLKVGTAGDIHAYVNGVEVKGITDTTYFHGGESAYLELSPTQAGGVNTAAFESFGGGAVPGGGSSTPISGTDTGTETESNTLATQIPASDSYVISSAGVLAASIPASDTGGVGEAAGLSQAGTDSGGGSDTSNVSTALSGADNGAGTEAVLLLRQTTPESATAIEDAQLVTPVSGGTDSGIISEAQIVATPVTGTESGGDTEAITSLTVQQLATEAATVAEAVIQQALISGVDAATAVQAAFAAVIWSVTESAGASESAVAVQAPLLSGDVAHASETATVSFGGGLLLLAGTKKMLVDAVLDAGDLIDA